MKRSRTVGILLGLGFLALCPLLAVVGGVLLVLPVKSTRVMESGPEVAIVAQGRAMENAATSVSTAATHQFSPAPAATAPRFPFSFGLAEIIILAGLAGLLLLLGAIVVLIIARRRRAAYAQEKDTALHDDEGDAWTREAKVRYAVFAVLAVLALSIFLIFDLLGSASLYWRFVAVYVGFWVLVGVLLLPSRPLGLKLGSLAILVLVLFSLRYVDWNSRKPFLRDLYSIDEGMTAAQVEGSMREYMKSDGGNARYDQSGQIVAGTVTFRHTNEGWGDSDWGVVTFEDGRVVQVQFLPD